MIRVGLLLLSSAVVAQTPSSPRPVPVGVSVERVLVDARVLDRGRALPDLGAEHFRVRIDGQPAEVVSVAWLSAQRRDSSAPPATPRGGGGKDISSLPDVAAPSGSMPPLDPSRGRLVVLFVQKDLHPTRAPGLLQLLDHAARLVRRLGPEDRAAVVSFDTHLKLWQDFTSDPVRVRRALTHDILFEEEPPLLPPSGSPSLAAGLDRRRSRRAAAPESALQLIGEALRYTPGSKTLVFLGFGMGEAQGPRIVLHSDYGPARRALLEAGVTVFSLDVTDADQHTLEMGLQQVAGDTGGFYARTHQFSATAMTRLEQALEGHYVLEVVPPGGRRGRHAVKVDLVGRRGEVFARSAYFD